LVNQERKKTMQKNSNRKGLALGAIFALVASLFVSAPAQAATDGANIGAYPAQGSTFAGVVTEDFPVYVQLKPGNPNTDFADNKLVFKVEKTAGTAMDVAVSASETAASIQSATSASHLAAAGKLIQAGSVSATVSGNVSAGGAAYLNFKASSVSAYASWSAVTLKVTAWIDTQGGAANDVIDSDEWFTTFTVTLARPESLTPGITITAPNAGDSVLTVSATVTGANFANLDGTFWLAMSSSGNVYSNGAGNASTSTKVGTAISSSALALRSGVLSQSFVVETGSMSANATISAAVRYNYGPVDGMYGGNTVGAVSKVGVAAVAADTLALSLVNSDDALSTSGHVRLNKTYTVRVHAKSAGVSASGVAVTIKFAGSTGLVTGSKTVSINGGAELTSYPASVTVTTGTDGYASWTMKATGFAHDEVIKVQATVGNTSATEKVLTMKREVYSIENVYDYYVTAPGTAVNISYEVTDQFGVLSSRNDQRIKVTRSGDGFNYSETISYVAVTAGKATLAFTPTPATKTGSAIIAAALESKDADGASWASGGSADGNVTVNVTDVADAFSVSPVASQSASVSYFPSTVSYKTVTTTVKNAGASVEVSGPAALIFRETGKTTTSSGKLTLRAGSTGAVSFDVAALLVGTHTITIKVGSASTTSLLVVDPVKGSAGVKIAFDKSSINAGETSVITGKVTDANGNAVDTTNTDGSTALLVVSYTGKGLPFNTGSTIETDEKGEFKVNILALAGDAGTGTLTATYRPAGAAVDANNVTATQTIAIVAPAAPAAPEVNAVIGTFNGRVAVRVENAKGSVVSVKIGGSWFKYTSLNDNYLFSRKSVKGRTVAVAVYVNGTLENVATITVK
jgi:hypothetical protein